MPKILVTESLGNSTRQFFLFVFSDESPTVFDRNIISNFSAKGMVFLPKVMKCQLKKWRDIESQLISSPVIELYVLQGHDTLLILLHNQHVWANIFHKIEVRSYRSFCANVSLCCRNKPWPIWLLRGCVWVICYRHDFFLTISCTMIFSSRGMCMYDIFFLRVNISFFFWLRCVNIFR